jgi:hypothetical protein
MAASRARGYRPGMHHKRHKSPNQRAGCKLCKPWKLNGWRTERADGEKFSDHRRRDAAKREIGVHA